jgi:ribosome-associated translation inhibitor RaiA
METPVHIDFQGMEPKEKLHAAIARHVAELEKRFGRITACRVVLKGPGQHHRTGGLFEVHIRLALPDEKEVNVGHKPDTDERHAGVNFAINDAFKRARRGLQDQVRRLQGHVKTHESRAEAAWPTTESGADKSST